MDVSEEDKLDAFLGLNESYTIMEKAQRKKVPVCHFKPMIWEDGEDESGWICHYCTHTRS
jgi:hypothetical protein